MAGLNNFLSDTQQTSTTMPAWYDQAQQSIVNQGGQAMANAPTLGQTTAQGAINTLQGPQNPFTQAQGTLQQISSGAANPWITDPTTGEVTPNTGTAMGGLFAAQQQELNQLMPNYSAPAQAGAIGSGNFGSLRGQTAVQKGRGDAFAKLNAQQLQAALTNQQQGVSAATGLGNVGQQGINAAMNVGQTQMNAPFSNLANYSNLISSMPVPTTTQSQVQYSPLGQIQAVGNAAQGGLGALYKTESGKNILDKLGLGGLFGGGSSSGGSSGLTQNLSAGSYPLADGGNMLINADGSRVITQADGTVSSYDRSGNSLGATTNAGDVDSGGVTEQDLYNQESGNTDYTQDQLDEYQNYYPTYE